MEEGFFESINNKAIEGKTSSLLCWFFVQSVLVGCSTTCRKKSPNKWMVDGLMELLLE